MTTSGLPATELNVFCGGPQDNEVWTVPELLYGKLGEDGSVARWIKQYDRTQERMRPYNDDREAVIWRHASTL